MKWSKNNGWNGVLLPMRETDADIRIFFRKVMCKMLCAIDRAMLPARTSE